MTRRGLRSLRAARHVLAIAAASSLSLAGQARAAGPLDVPLNGNPPLPTTGIERIQGNNTWSVAPPRTFVSATLDAGYIYLRPRVSFGRGQPHWRWVGFDFEPVASTAGFGFYGGARAALPYADIRAGARELWAVRRSFLAPREHYDRWEIQSRAGPNSRYLSLETELNAAVPFGPGNLINVLTVLRVEGVPEGYYVFEEILRMVIAPGWLLRGRLGYALSFGPRDAVSVGLVGEVLGNPGGRKHIVVRGGLVGSVSISPALDVLGTVVPVLWSHDQVGLAGGEFVQLGVRYRWATGW